VSETLALTAPDVLASIYAAPPGRGARKLSSGRLKITFCKILELRLGDFSGMMTPPKIMAEAGGAKICSTDQADPQNYSAMLLYCRRRSARQTSRISQIPDKISFLLVAHAMDGQLKPQASQQFTRHYL